MRLPASICAVSHAPHQWLFPRVSVAVHHAGAGTVAAALRAGTPMALAPIAVDQFFWSRRVEALGVGRALRRRPISARALAEALVETAHDRVMRQRARQMQQILSAEDGLGRAVEFILPSRRL
jgi:sterol 3beta-glucosyltransferase